MDIIVAIDSNWGIGYRGTQTLVLPEDRRHFRELTAGHTVITGRRTFSDFPGGKPLKNRQNIILSTDRDFSPEGALVVHDLHELSQAVAGLPANDIFVIGGESLYRQLLSYCRRAFVTRIEADSPADRFFPNLDASPDWVMEDSSELYTSGDIKYRFITYRNQNIKELES